jgi:REP element-mobilizing transposase RayT/transposase-like protein
MSRPLRLHAPGLLHHVFARGNEKACIFADDHDYAAFLKLLADTLPRFATRCVAYCLLWNHYHLLLVPNEHRVSLLLQQLNSTYCQRFNRRHGRVGHVLQGRFGCRVVEDGAYARSVLRYLALNPVAAGRAANAEDWPWSSYRFVLGHAGCPDYLSLEDTWNAFATSDCAEGRDRLREFVAAGLGEVFSNPILHGSPHFAHQLADRLEPHQGTRDYVYAARYAARPTLGSLLDGCLDRRALQDAARAAFHQHAYTLAEIAAAVSRDPSVVSRWIRQSKLRQSPGVAGCPPRRSLLQETRSDPLSSVQTQDGHIDRQLVFEAEAGETSIVRSADAERTRNSCCD